MSLKVVSTDELRIDDAPVVIVVPVYGQFEHVGRLLASLEHTVPEGVPVLLIDDATPEAPLRDVCGDLLESSRVRYLLLRRASNVGFVENCNLAFGATGTADVIVCNSDVVVYPGWYERLCAAGTSSTLVASASVPGSNASILTVPLPGLGAASDIDWEQAAAQVAALEPWHPEIPTAIGHLMYLTRRALSVVGGFDTRFSPGYGEEVEWSQRALQRGLRHVVADTVVVQHQGRASFSGARFAGVQEEHDRMVDLDFPLYAHTVSYEVQRRRSPWLSALLRASVAMRGLHVRIDGRGMGDRATGTEVTMVRTALALAEDPAVARLQVVVEDRFLAHFREALVGLDVVGASAVRDDSSADIAFRPCHPRSAYEVEQLLSLGRRAVFQQLDFIAYSNPYYFPDAESWQHYRAALELAYHACDGVAFLSPFVADEARRLALDNGAVPQRTVLAGIDHMPFEEAAPSREPYVVVLGASFQHKNRVWALRLFERMRALGYPGKLVLAGPEPTHGGSSSDEGALLAASPVLASQVHYEPWLPDTAMRGLIRGADLVLYPTTSEGFGLVPFEAARLGTPTLASDGGAMGDTMPNPVCRLDLRSLDASARTALDLISDPALAEEHVHYLLKCSSTLTWAAVAAHLGELLTEVAHTRARSQADHVYEKLQPHSTPRWRDSDLRHRVLPRGTKRAYMVGKAFKASLELRQQASRRLNPPESPRATTD